MICREIHDLLSCYIDGELTEKEKTEFEAHLLSCASCRHALEEMQGFVVFLSSLSTEPLPKDFAAEFNQSLPNIMIEKKKRFSVRSRLALVAAFFLIFIGAIAVFGNALQNTEDFVATQSAPASVIQEEAGETGNELEMDTESTETEQETESKDASAAAADLPQETETMAYAANYIYPLLDENGSIVVPEGGDCYYIRTSLSSKESILTYLNANVSYTEYEDMQTEEGEERVTFFLTVEEAERLGNNLLEMGILTGENGLRIPAAEYEDYLAMTEELAGLEEQMETADAATASLSEKISRLTLLMSLVKVDIRLN